MFCQKHGDYEDVAEDDYGDDNDSDDIDVGTEDHARLDPAEVKGQNPWTASSHLSISEAQEEETQGCTSTYLPILPQVQEGHCRPQGCCQRAFSVCTCKLWTFHICTWSIHPFLSH